MATSEAAIRGWATRRGEMSPAERKKRELAKTELALKKAAMGAPKPTDRARSSDQDRTSLEALHALRGRAYLQRDAASPRELAVAKRYARMYSRR